MTGFIDPLVLAEGDPGDDAARLDRVRDLVLRAHPEVVPELIAGATIDDLLESIAPASAAYQALASRIDAARPQPVQVPAGAMIPGALDPDALSPVEKLRRGLADRSR